MVRQEGWGDAACEDPCWSSALLKDGPCGMYPCWSSNSCSLWKAHVRSAGEERHPVGGTYMEQEQRVTVEEQQRQNIMD